MRVLLVDADGRGGIGHYTAELANALAKNEENEVFVFYPHPDSETPTLINKNVKSVCMNIPKTRAKIKNLFEPACATIFYIFNLVRLLWKINKISPQVIHFQQPDLRLYLPFLLLPSEKKVITMHDSQPALGKRKWFSRWIFNEYARRCALIFVHADAIRKEITDLYDVAENKIKVTPHADYTFFLKWKKNIEPVPNTLLFFGAIRRNKGLHVLMQAVKKVLLEIPDLKVIVAGQLQDDWKFYEKFFATEKKHYEFHLKYIPNEDVPYFFQRCELVILPHIQGSVTGIFPVAAAFKKPTVATKVGGTAEEILHGETGLLVEPNNPTLLAEAILYLLRNKSFAKSLGENAYRRFVEVASWDKVTPLITKAYQLITA